MEDGEREIDEEVDGDVEVNGNVDGEDDNS